LIATSRSKVCLALFLCFLTRWVGLGGFCSGVILLFLGQNCPLKNVIFIHFRLRFRKFL
jgi:hypothetical protein